ncbi:MAG TPA: hypothetical protein VH054_10980 [Polyangiaceae bacterium]|jgi:hypothetical protein|nr:hypothetical protein [Polyangiaceae bacterium]
MRRTTLAFLTASLAIHAGAGGVAYVVSKIPHVEHGAPKPVFNGETFEIAGVITESPREVVTEPAPSQTKTDDEAAEAVHVARPHVTTHGENTMTGAEAPLTYGALGDRSAVDVTVALARGFPQAASPDAEWRTVPLGDAGAAILDIDLEEDGTLARWGLGAGASPALREGIRRTMAFIGGRTFLAHGKTTRLHVSAHVTTDATRDGTDAVYAIHSEHDGPSASAYFSLSVGRRVDLTITPAR